MRLKLPKYILQAMPIRRWDGTKTQEFVAESCFDQHPGFGWQAPGPYAPKRNIRHTKTLTARVVGVQVEVVIAIVLASEPTVTQTERGDMP